MQNISTNYDLANYGRKLLPFPSSMHDALNININNYMWPFFASYQKKKKNLQKHVNTVNNLIEVNFGVHTWECISLTPPS